MKRVARKILETVDYGMGMDKEFWAFRGKRG